MTLVFTDIEGSTRLLEELGTDAYRDALAEHRRIVREACARHDGYEVDYEGDAFFYAFASAQAAVSAVTEAMQGLDGGPIRIRVGIHTGEPALDPPKYVGLDVHRAARIMSAAHGGQVVLSPSTVALLEPGTVAAEGPRPAPAQRPLRPDPPAPAPTRRAPRPSSRRSRRSTAPTCPSRPPRSSAARQELAEVVETAHRPDTRLLTLTGPGGTGKTRLALQAAAEAADHYPDGISWVPLAPLRDARAALPTIAQALELRRAPGNDAPSTARADPAREARTLLLLDNAEHLLPGAGRATLAALVAPARR